MTGFNKTLDVNLEHTGLDYTRNQSINNQQFFRKEENTKASVFSADLGRCCYAFCALVCTFFDRSSSIFCPFSFNDVEVEIALTSRRCDVEVSERWSLVDFLFSFARRRVFVTLGRRDVGASRGWDVATFLSSFCSYSLCSKMIPKIARSTFHSHKMQESDIRL